MSHSILPLSLGRYPGLLRRGGHCSNANVVHTTPNQDAPWPKSHFSCDWSCHHRSYFWGQLPLGDLPQEEHGFNNPLLWSFRRIPLVWPLTQLISVCYVKRNPLSARSGQRHCVRSKSPSSALNLTSWIASELKRNKSTTNHFVLGMEVAGHQPEQLTQTLRV